MRSTTLLMLIMLPCALAATAAGQADRTVKKDHVVLTYSGVDAKWAEAIARVVSATRAAAAEVGFDMPQTIRVTVQFDPNGRLRLWNDGQDRITLELSSDRQLLKPSASGVFNVYGLCHEIGHLAMYRAIRDHSFLRPDAAEGWAHYLGSRLVDVVYAKEGAELWPDAYDYRQDGTKRLEAQLAQKQTDAFTSSAARWKELCEILGDKAMAELLAAWGKAKIDAADPGAALGPALLAAKRDDRLAGWWKAAEGELLAAQAKSRTRVATTRPSDLSGQPKELALDDGIAVGKRSVAGSGHAVAFQAPGPGWYLTKVTVYGSRYGAGGPESFRLWLCDKEFKTITEFQFACARFDRAANWVRLDVPPTLVPAEFIVCLGFSPTASKGVFVHCDAQGCGSSLLGLPGREAKKLADGDWLIRAWLDQPKVLPAPATSARQKK